MFQEMRMHDYSESMAPIEKEVLVFSRICSFCTCILYFYMANR